MKINFKDIKVFFAIPCGEYFSTQNKIIKQICNNAGIKPIIIEDYSRTDSLWEKISEAIDLSDYFICDISSLSSNIMMELGYCIREKRTKNYAIFISKNIEKPVNLQGFKFQEYNSFKDFQKKLIKWILDNVPFIEKDKLDNFNKETSLEIVESFKDYDRFYNLWFIPPYCQFKLTEKGFHFSNAHITPIMTTHLSLLNNFCFEFKARILKNRVGWIIKGTRYPNSPIPNFFIMFNIGKSGDICPHIFNNIINEKKYKRFDKEFVSTNNDLSNKWFVIKTLVLEDQIEILINDNSVFNKNFKEEPFKKYYDFQNKLGEIGFRCYSDEEAIN